MSHRIEPASPRDLPALRALLTSVGLPSDGLAEQMGLALLARDADETIGCVALERYGAAALLRSLAVTPSRQGHGLGRALTRAAIEVGRQHGLTRLYLLTLSAGDFFGRHFDFRAIAWSDVPSSVRQSAQFKGVCPDTAQAMVLEIAR